jgi:hypothetical protein
MFPPAAALAPLRKLVKENDQIILRSRWNKRYCIGIYVLEPHKLLLTSESMAAACLLALLALLQATSIASSDVQSWSGWKRVGNTKTFDYESKVAAKNNYPRMFSLKVRPPGEGIDSKPSSKFCFTPCSVC